MWKNTLYKWGYAIFNSFLNDSKKNNEASKVTIDTSCCFCIPNHFEPVFCRGWQLEQCQQQDDKLNSTHDVWEMYYWG